MSTKQKRKRTTYTLDILLALAIKIHGDKFIYDEITEDHINHGVHSRIPITCRSCGHKWDPTIGIHINSKSNCPKCCKKNRWTLPNFLIRAKEIHGDKFDYSNILLKDIENKYSHVKILCNSCNNTWNPTIASHINGKDGCPNCPKICDWTWEKFQIKISEINCRDKYDYSLVTKEHIKGAYCNIPIICLKCNHNWFPFINDHFNKLSGCPKCKFSKGEIACLNYLKSILPNVTEQKIIPQLPKRKYDFSFEHKNMFYILEFDGQQHFDYVKFYHKNIEKFQRNQNGDILKTLTAIENGFNIIRIDYRSINDIKYHVDKALELKNLVYVTDIICLYIMSAIIDKYPHLSIVDVPMSK